MRGNRASGLITAVSMALLTVLAVSLAPSAAHADSGSPSPSPSDSPTASPTATPTPSPAPPPGPRLGSPEIFGWLPYWSLNANIDYGAITTIAYFGLNARADGHLAKGSGSGWNSEYSGWMGSRVSQAISQAHANGDRFVLSVERFAWDDTGLTATRALLSDPNARATLVADIVGEITARGVDGVSLDFEPILSDQRDNFAAFVRELRLGLDAVNPAYQLTFATTGSQTVKTLQMINDLTAGGWADAEIIMGYPLRDLSAARAGSLDPLSSPTSYDLKQIVNTHLGYVAPDKVVLALPWYAREWPTQTADVNAKVQTDRSLYGRPQNSTYQAGLNAAIAYGRQVDPAEEAAWTVFQAPNCEGCPVTWMEIYYDDVETFGYKVDWALSKGLAGIGIFALGYDNGRPEFWKLLEVKFGRPQKLVDNAAPTGTFGLDPGDKLCSAPQVQLDFSLSDGQYGSGTVLLRVSNSSAADGTGLLSAARVYPATDQINWAMDDPSTGGSLSTGTRRVYAQWRDVAGNWSTVSSTSFKLTLPGAAQLTVAGGASYTTNTTVGVLVEKTGGRAITALKLSNSPDMSGGVLANAVDATLGATNNFSLVNPATGGTDVDGPHSVYAQWLDSAGCWSPVASSTLVLDRVPPTGTVSVVGSPAVTPTRDVQLLVPATDNASGVAHVGLSNDGNHWTVLPYTGAPVDWSAGANQADGPWKIRARWQDAAGNWSSTASTTVVLDTHPPVGSIVLDGGASATGSDTVTVADKASDASGVSQLILSNSPALTGGVLSNAASFSPNGTVAWPLSGAGAPVDVAEGAHTVYAQWQDMYGQWSSVASATILVDRTPPQVSPPQVGLLPGAQLGTATVPLLVSWQATDSGSGVAGARVERSADGLSWQLVAQVPASNGQQTTLSLAPDSATQLRISATDKAGNASQPVAGGQFRATLVQDTSKSVVYTGAWTTKAVSSASGGTLHFAKAKGATASLTFTGRAVAWAAPHAQRRGKAKVFLDGAYVATVNLRGPAAQRLFVFSHAWASVGTHTIVVRVLHTRRRPRVDLDAFVVLT
jgi:hypothetical protein